MRAETITNAARGRTAVPPGKTAFDGSNARASLRKRLRFVADETVHDYRDVTPLSWGERFHDQDWVSTPAMCLIAERGGHG